MVMSSTGHNHKWHHILPIAWLLFLQCCNWRIMEAMSIQDVCCLVWESANRENWLSFVIDCIETRPMFAFNVRTRITASEHEITTVSHNYSHVRILLVWRMWMCAVKDMLCPGDPLLHVCQGTPSNLLPLFCAARDSSYITRIQLSPVLLHGWHREFVMRACAFLSTTKTGLTLKIGCSNHKRII